jgi:hypothetical protein
VNDACEKRIRGAAVAGRSTLPVAVIFLTLQWLAYLAIMSARPACLLTVWGPDVRDGTAGTLPRHSLDLNPTGGTPCTVHFSQPSCP